MKYKYLALLRSVYDGSCSDDFLTRNLQKMHQKTK